MGSFANSLFKIILGWFQGAVAAVWSAFTSDHGNSLFNWIGKNWLLIAGILCLTGLAADLCVYILRWKPFRVWKSFFHRRREPEEDGQAYAAAPEEQPEAISQTYDTPGKQIKQKPLTVSTDNRTAPDLSQWETPPEEIEQPVQPPDKPATVTNAGYIVPADSPYRRPPAEQTQNTGYTGQEQIIPPLPDRREKDTPVVMKTKRRRRISVNELFSDPEEELRQFDAPQSIIDSKKAYRRPVYPQGWKNNEDGET